MIDLQASKQFLCYAKYFIINPHLVFLMIVDEFLPSTKHLMTM